MANLEKSTNWLEELANAEVTMEQTGQIDAFGHLQEEKILEDHTFSYLNELRTLFQNYASHFNQTRKDSRQTIKVYGIANTKSDFLVFRNSLKLVVTVSKPGQIEVSFHTLSGGLYAPLRKKASHGKGKIPRPPGEIESQQGDFIDLELGPFNEAHRTFQNIPITSNALVRYYLTEFIKTSAC